MMSKGIYVGVKEIDYIVGKIDSLCSKFCPRQVSDSSQRRALFKHFCYDTIAVFDDCFEPSLLGIKQCKRRVETYRAMDDPEIDSASRDIVGMLWELKAIVRKMVPIKDLPSCKDLVKLSAGDIISKAKDLIGSGVVKAGVAGALLGLKINDVVRIEDVLHYYHGLLAELNSEVEEQKDVVSPFEQFLIDKCNAEIGYCNCALLKTGIGITEELKSLVEMGKEHIERYEQQWKDGVGRLTVGEIGAGIRV